MATLAQLRTRVDDWLAGFWPTFVARQGNYLGNRGRYWQGLLTHTVVPAHTNAANGDSIPDRINVHPSDQFEDWITAFPEWENVAIPAAVRCDTYDGATGKGYCATIFVRYNGTLYSRSQNVGPEFDRTHDWVAEGD